MKPFLVDVYAVHPSGHDRHLGGGLFHATSALEAERMATEEYWQPQLNPQGFEIGFKTDMPETGQKVMSLERLRASASRALCC